MPQTLDPQQDRSRLIKALLEVSKLHTMQLEPDAMLDLILEHLGEVVPYDSASILLRQGETELRIVAGRGYAQSPAVLDTVFDTRTIRRFHSILNNRLPVRIADVRESPDWVEIAGTEHIRAWIGVPLNSRGKIIGVLSVDRSTPNAFGDDDLKIAYTFANEVAVAIENALLADAVEEQRNAIEHASRNEAIPPESGRPKSRILKAVLNAAPRNLLPAFPTPPGSPPVRAPLATPAAPTEVGATPPRPAEQAGGVSTNPQLAALEAKVRRGRFPTPKAAASPRPLGAGIVLMPPGGETPSTVPAAPTEVGATAVPVVPSAADLKRETLLFGRILLSNNLVKPESLEECLRLQERIRVMGLEVRLGQLCVDRGLIDVKTLDAVLKIQKQKFLISSDPLALRRKGLTADTDIPLGRLAIENGLITQAQLDEAIAIQQRIRTLGVEKRLGEILVEKRSLTEEGLDGLLQVQRQRSKTLPAVAPAEPAPQTTKPTSKLGLDDAAYAALDNDLLVRLIRPSGLLTKTQLAECERLRTELEASSVQKRVDEIAVQRGFATAEAIRKIVDMEFLKWRETAGKAPARPAPVAAGAQKRRGMGMEIAAAAVVVIGLGAGVWYQATRPSRDKETRADEMARAKTDLQAMAKTIPPPAAVRSPTPVPVASMPTVPPETVLPPPSEGLFDVESELASASSFFPGEPEGRLGLRGVTRVAAGGEVEFVAYGRGPFTDETPVTVTLQLAGREIGVAEPAAAFRGGYFVGRVRLGSHRGRLASGVYTLQAVVPTPGFDPSTTFQANPDMAGRGGGSTRARLLARASVLVGSMEGAQAERESLARIYTEVAGGMAVSDESLSREASEAAGRPGSSLEDWVGILTEWEAGLSQVVAPARNLAEQMPATPCPEVASALDTLLRALHDRAVAEGAALARRRRLPIPEEYGGGENLSPASAAAAVRDSLAAFRASIERMTANSLLRQAAGELAAIGRSEADAALDEVSKYLDQASATQPPPRLRLEAFAGWTSRVRALATLDDALVNFAESEGPGIGKLLSEYAVLTEACGRARVTEWLEARQLPVPADIRPREQRTAERLTQDRTAVQVKLDRIASASFRGGK